VVSGTGSGTEDLLGVGEAAQLQVGVTAQYRQAITLGRDTRPLVQCHDRLDIAALVEGVAGLVFQERGSHFRRKPFWDLIPASAPSPSYCPARTTPPAQARLLEGRSGRT